MAGYLTSKTSPPSQVSSRTYNSIHLSSQPSNNLGQIPADMGPSDLNIARSLSSQLIPGPPASMYYLPRFVNKDNQSRLLTDVYGVPLPQWRQLAHRRLQSQPSPLSAQNALLDAPLPEWLRVWAEQIATLPLHAQGADFSKPGLLFSDSPHKGPNHCLVNEYKPGQGIMPHEDGPAYYPITATVSLGSHAVLEVTMKQNKDAKVSMDMQELAQQKWRILCEPGSLLITTGEAYVRTLHAIEPIEEDRDICDPKLARGDDMGVANWNLLADREGWERDGGVRRRETRVSLTYRDVLKVKSMKAFGLMKGTGKMS